MLNDRRHECLMTTASQSAMRQLGKERERQERKSAHSFIFCVLDERQVNASTTHYSYNNIDGGNTTIDIPFFLSSSLPRCLWFALISMQRHRPSSLHTRIHYPSQKKIIDSKQLCSMCVCTHRQIYMDIKNRFLSIIGESRCQRWCRTASFSRNNRTSISPRHSRSHFFLRRRLLLMHSQHIYAYTHTHTHTHRRIFKRGTTLLKFPKSKFAFFFSPRQQLLDKWQN